MPGQGARGLSREQAADVEARLERHLRDALLAAGRAKGMGEVFGQELSGQVLPAPACPLCPPAEHGADVHRVACLDRARGRQGLSELVGLTGESSETKAG